MAADRLWPGATIVCIATGPSLTLEDVDFCRGRARVVVVKNAVQLAPWADAVYACDARWWAQVAGLPDFAGLKFAMEDARAAIAFAKHDSAWPGVKLLENTGEVGLEVNPDGLRTGKNSGYQAMNLAVHLGASRIVLLGYDMQTTGGKQHFFGRHPWLMGPSCERFRPFFDHLVQPLATLGISVVNATRATALTCWPCVSLEQALSETGPI